MPHTRLPSIDALRGLAIVLMIAYHFCYDLTYFGFARFDFFNDPFWLHSRTFILSLFLLVAGMSLTLATCDGVRLRPYLQRLGLIAGCAALISLTSHFMFGPRWIFFGVLHFIVVASVLGLAFVRRPRTALLCGSTLIALDRVFAHPLFDQTALQWLGLMTHKPPTEDYVPLIPWFGVVLIGISLGHALRRRITQPQRPSDALPVRLLASAGRHSLVIYMLHQPVLMGTLWILRRLGTAA